jgi:hypothetical protein
MYSESDLEAAVAAGALTPQAANALRDYVSGERATPAVDEEHFRLITGFNDIFVSVAAVILLAAMAFIGNEIPPHVEIGGPSPFAACWSPAPPGASPNISRGSGAWPFQAFSCCLPSLPGLMFSAALSMAMVIGEAALRQNENLGGWVAAFAGLVGAGAAWIHWRRFRVPITVAAGAAAVVGIGLGLLAVLLGDTPTSPTRCWCSRCCSASECSCSRCGGTARIRLARRGARTWPSGSICWRRL